MRYTAMNKDNVLAIEGRETITADTVTQLLKSGAQQLLQQAIEVEVHDFMQQFQSRLLDDGRAAVVRNGYQPERDLQTGIGPVTVKVPKVRSRDGKPVTFRSALVPPYVRKTKSLEAALPWLYLKGVSTGEMSEALEVLVGPEASGLSASTVARLKQQWADEYDDWSKKPLNKQQWVYLWVDGIHSGVRAEDAKLCALTVIGVDEKGHKHLLAIEEGHRESTQSWREVLFELKARGMNTPQLCTGDGALGFWAAADQILPGMRHQRCWVHKTANVLNKLPKSAQPKAKQAIHEIWMAETKENAEAAFDLFITTYEDKYPGTTQCLLKDQDELLTFYDFPAAHWKSIRTTNPIESTFATIRHRTKRSKGCLSRTSMLHMMFKLGQCAQKRWHRLRGFDHLAKVITGVKFKDGIEVIQADQIAA
jgi:putative transposase